MTSKDDPVERHWEAQVDQAARAAAHERDMATIRSVGGLGQLDTKLERLRSTQEYARLSRHIADERDRLEARFRQCEHFSERACESWAEQAGAIARTAEDDHAAIEQLHDELVTATNTLQRDLNDIAEAITNHSTLTSASRARGKPVLARLHEARSAASSTVGLIRSRIATCEHLREETRRDWLSALPDHERSLDWLRDQQTRAAGTALRRQLTAESESAAHFTDRAYSSLRLLKTFLETRAST